MCISLTCSQVIKKNLGLEFESTGIKILEKTQDNKLTRKESVGFILIFSQSL